MVAIVDYGMGNLRSVEKACIRAGKECCITSDAAQIEKAEKLILPGVGHFKSGMENLKQRGLIEVLNRSVMDKKTPLLGICLGMQLLTNYSEEGKTKGLGWIDAETMKFDFDEVSRLKIPHIGWNNAVPAKPHWLFEGISTNDLFYFVHSYYVKVNTVDASVAQTTYGITFDASIQHQHIVGVQFHPEKSHDIGLTLLQNFLAHV
jgi:glutamine amidotransferase